MTERRCLELVRGGLDDDSVDVRYLGHRLWEPTALMADRYRIGRVFLAGDAADVTAPVGGLGMNCGVADAHNLSWKLAGVLAGWDGPALLESCEPERGPHAVACADASLGPADRPEIPLACHVIHAAAWHDLYGVERGGVVLVRPGRMLRAAEHPATCEPTRARSSATGLLSATVPTPQTSNGTFQLRPF